MICFIRRSTIDYDIRLRKYIEACAEGNVPYIAITWDRMKNCSTVYENEIQYKVSSPYGSRMMNLLTTPRWLLFLYYNMFKNWRKYKVIHACNLEVYIFVLPFKLLGKKLIFDVYDSVNTKIESLVCRWANILILPHEKRLMQIGVDETAIKKLFVVENVPRFTSKIESCTKEINLPGSPITLAYVGVLEVRNRGIENLLEFVSKDKRFELQIAGVGANMEILVESYCKKCERIKYYGKVSYNHALNIMNNAHFIVALYYQSDPLHKYASPNKYYESLYLGKPLITSNNTLVGLQVVEGNTGYVVDDNLESLETLFDDVASESFIEGYKVKARNCMNLWKCKYLTYFDDVIINQYLNLVRSLSK